MEECRVAAACSDPRTVIQRRTCFVLQIVRSGSDDVNVAAVVWCGRDK